MPDKTKIIVVIESHEQTIIRRSRRLSSQLLTEEGAAQTADRATVATRLPNGRRRLWSGARWLAVALKRSHSFLSLVTPAQGWRKQTGKQTTIEARTSQRSRRRSAASQCLDTNLLPKHTEGN